MLRRRALVWRLWVWPRAAPMASIHVRPTLLNGSCSVSDQPDVCECVRRASDLGFLGLNCFTILAQSIRAARILANFHEVVHADCPEERQAGCECVDIHTCVDTCAKIFKTVGKSVCQLDIAGCACLLHMVAGDRYGVELGHILRCVLEYVGDDSHREFRRVDIGVTHHEFLENVVLNRTAISSSLAPCSRPALI